MAIASPNCKESDAVRNTIHSNTSDDHSPRRATQPPKKGGNQNPTRLLDELVDRSSTSVASKGSESVRDDEEAPSRCILFTSIMSPTGNTGQVDKSLFAAILKPPELLRRIVMRWRTAADKVQKFSRRTRHEETFTYT